MSNHSSRNCNSLLLLRLTKDLRESLSAGLGRIEYAASTAADVAGQEQRIALESVTRDISSQLQRRLEDQLSSLRTSMELSATQPDTARKPEDDPQTSVALERAAQAVEQAAAALAQNAAEAGPGATPLGQVAGVLEHAVEQIEEAHQEAGEEGASADAISGLRDEVTRMHEQMVESVMAASDAPPADPVPAPPAHGGEGDEADDGSRSGYSALLHRYQAPRFSLDELAPELRTLDTEAMIERARSAGVAPDGSLVPTDTPAATEAEPEAAPPAPPAEVPVLAAAPDPEPVDDEVDDDPDDEQVEEPADEVEEQRLRLAQFLRRR